MATSFSHTFCRPNKKVVVVFLEEPCLLPVLLISFTEVSGSGVVVGSPKGTLLRAS